MAIAWAKLYRKSFVKKYHSELSQQQQVITQAFGNIVSKSEIVNAFLPSYLYAKLLHVVFKRVHAKRVIGPARQFLNAPFIAARRLGMQAFELQHGVTYGETLLYSGYRDEMLLPDYFLSFGNNKPSDVYGIDESRIVNIGWALQDYIAKLPQENTWREQDVLVVSDPEVTDAMIEAVLPLAKAHPDSMFYLRPHPQEVITQAHRARMATVPNFVVQDNRINITVVLQGFTHVVGENTTVLYEALAARKKVGKLFGQGLNPRYLEASDRDAFWEIRSDDDFRDFLQGNVNDKVSKCIYSPFDREAFLKALDVE